MTPNQPPNCKCVMLASLPPKFQRCEACTPKAPTPEEIAVRRAKVNAGEGYMGEVIEQGLLFLQTLRAIRARPDLAVEYVNAALGEEKP
jgi:hypothetical protein